MKIKKKKVYLNIIVIKYCYYFIKYLIILIITMIIKK